MTFARWTRYLQKHRNPNCLWTLHRNQKSTPAPAKTPHMPNGPLQQKKQPIISSVEYECNLVGGADTKIRDVIIDAPDPRFFTLVTNTWSDKWIRFTHVRLAVYANLENLAYFMLASELRGASGVLWRANVLEIIMMILIWATMAIEIVIT